MKVNKPMTLLEELKIFVKTILHWIYAFGFFAIFLFVFGIEETVIFEQRYILPVPTDNSFSIQIFNMIQRDVLPAGVQLIVVNPMSAFVSQILFSLLLSLLLTIPYFLYKLTLYIVPALLPHEKRVVIWSLVPCTFLFFAGSAFSYFFLIPATFKVLYPYATLIGAAPFFGVDEFIYYIFSLMIVVGVMFLLPLFMTLFSFMGIIPAEFWKNSWRYALLFFLISSAIITPDGTGVTMAMLFLPLVGLYFAGYVFARKLSR